MGADIVIAVDISLQPKEIPASGHHRHAHAEHTHHAAVHPGARTGSRAGRGAPGHRPDAEIDTASKLRLIKSGEDAANAALPQIREWLQKTANEKMLHRAEQQRLKPR